MERDRPERKRRVSMADVARLAGVSSQTVSRVSSGTGDVVDATRARVLAAMAELGYRPNGAARALKLGEFRTIGVVVFSLASFGNMRTVEAIAESAANEDYAITLIPVSAPTQERISGAFTRLDELAVDGIIVIMEVSRLDASALTLPHGTPVVVVDSDAGSRFDVVDTDQADGAHRAVTHLPTSGTTRCGMWPGPRTRSPAAPAPALALDPGGGGAAGATTAARRLVGGLRLRRGPTSC